MILNKLGLAARARKIISGESMVVDAIKAKQALLVLISNDCQKNTLDKIVSKCTYYEVEYMIIPYDKYELGNAIGKDLRVCVAISDLGFVKMIKK